MNVNEYIGKTFIENKKEYKIIKYFPRNKGSWMSARFVAELIEEPYIHAYKNGNIYLTGHNTIEKTEIEIVFLIDLNGELYD